MKKSLIALAALAFVGAASAQSSITLYGVADIWIGKPEGGKIQAGSGGNGTGTMNASRWGLRGSEDLGGGLKAIFTLESGFSMANGAVVGTLFNRQANVGLEGGFGTVKLGQNWTAFDDIYGSANTGFDSALSANGVWKNLYAYSNGNSSSNAQIYYATPTFGGISGALSTKLKGNESATELKHTAFNVKYEGGPVYIGLAYEDDKGPITLKNTLINGFYDLGTAKLMASYYMTKPVGGIKTNSYQFGADVPVGKALTVSVGYASSKATGGKSATGFSVVTAYALSKRTTVYGGLRAANKEATGKDLWAVGVNHKF